VAQFNAQPAPAVEAAWSPLTVPVFRTV